MKNVFRVAFVAGLTVSCGLSLHAQDQKQPLIPHAQDKPPNDPRDPKTAASMMTVPEGFTVEVVAAEPDIVNPVAMTIDERGRFWITESLEYPRREPGPGKDRVKILEDTDCDGKADKFTVFLEGLNIPSGIAVGHGGVWIANSPDILFVQDTDGDGKADKQEVIVTGFGRTDTHELPNSLTWGPDGWLYGLNGVFNHSHVKYAKTNPNYDEKHPGWPLTCAMFRIHPRTREFQVFCEGTSNPWGIAFNDEGEAFVSACVIDHLWHLTETGYYHRQGGPYPPYTWKIESIVKHKHQKAAYCGIHYFDSDAYPETYRGKLYMGNIHGGCINVDRIKRTAKDGTTYEASGEPDFLTANDAWFMPVVQKTGPDGSLYILDWYDRYHCYQDANRDPAGIDRLKGRLYRVRYKDTPRVAPDFNLSRESDEKLIDRLNENNDFIRDTARRLLQERNSESVGAGLLKRLEGQGAIGISDACRRRMFMTLGGMTVTQSSYVRQDRLDPDATIQAWGFRFVGDNRSEASNFHELATRTWDRLSPRNHLQVVVAASKLLGAIRPQDRTDKNYTDFLRICINALTQAPNDPLLSRIVWQNLQPHLDSQAERFVNLVELPSTKRSTAIMEVGLRTVDRLLGKTKFDPTSVARLIDILANGDQEFTARSLGQISLKIQNRELSAVQAAELKQAMESQLKKFLGGTTNSPLYLPAAFLATSWNDPAGLNAVHKLFTSEDASQDQRLLALNALITAKSEGLIDSVAKALDSKSSTPGFRSQVLASLSKLDDPNVAQIVIARYEKLDPDLQPRAIELLTQRAAWAKQLLGAVGEKKIAANAINLNQARRLIELKDPELTKLISAHWGQVRESRDPDREQYIAGMRQLIRKTPGDAFAGEKAFKKVCAQCHKIYGEGAEVGPDITLNGRNNFNQLLSNVFDPSLVIGAGYRSYTVVTNGGRVLNGLLAEDSPQRIVLKIQGGKLEVIPRDDIDEFKVSEISLMPEQLEKQLTPQEITDLFAFLSLDKHPSDKSARMLAGAGEVVPRETLNPKEFGQLVNEILPDFTTNRSGEQGVGILKDHFGRSGVLRTHPVSAEQPCVLVGQFAIPAGKKTRLLVDVSHDAKGDWRLIVRANGEQLLSRDVGPKTCQDGWAAVQIDLSKFAGKDVRLELQNAATGWSWEYGYWGGARLISE